MKVTCQIMSECQDWKKFAKIRIYIRDVAKHTLQNLPQLIGVENVSVSILLSNNSKVQKLNSEYRGKDAPTNVLSFPDEERGLKIKFLEPDVFLGDLAFAFGVIDDEAKSQGKSFLAHLAHLIVHGILHLLGYDHIEESDREIMENLEIEILEKLGIANPYE